MVPMEDLHGIHWRTQEFVNRDDQGHAPYFGQAPPAPHAAA